MTKLKKVYLSVSYNTSTTVINAVKKLIEDEGVEVLMYHKGQKYSTDKLLKADMVLGIPPQDIYQEEPYSEDIKYNITVGKGQYGEAEFSVENDIPYYMLTEGLVKFSKFQSSYSNMPENWKTNYGNINLVDRYLLSDLLTGEEKSNLLLIL